MKKIGVLGAGQLGRMLALAGYPLGHHFRFFDPASDSPAGLLADHWAFDYADTSALEKFAKGLDVVTYEFENVPVETVRHLEKFVPVYPSAIALEKAQDRFVEKSFFRELGIPTAKFTTNGLDKRTLSRTHGQKRTSEESGLDERTSINGLCHGLADKNGLDERTLSRIHGQKWTSGENGFGFPAVLKTRRMGYDGKGQMVVRSEAEFINGLNNGFTDENGRDERTLSRNNGQEQTSEESGVDEQTLSRIHGQERTLGENGRVENLILEEFISFDRELSIIAVRNKLGEMRFYPLIENHHRDGILKLSIVGGDVSAELQKQAEEYARAVMNALDYVGVLTIEFFEKDGRLLANEMAPRVHNSGHWTIEGSITSQFENHVRAVSDAPLGNTNPLGVCGMVNLVGNLPDVEFILKIEGAHLHLYDKAPRAKRKIGHITFVEKDMESLQKKIEQVKEVYELF